MLKNSFHSHISPRTIIQALGKLFGVACLGTLIFFGACGTPTKVFGADPTKVGELKEKIDSHASKIDALNREIEAYKVQLDQVGKQSKSLQTDVKALDLTEKKLTTNLKVTENKIDLTALSIEQLSDQITEREDEIAKISDAVRSALLTLDQADNTPLVTTLLTSQKTSDFWGEVTRAEQLRTEITLKIDELRDLKKDLETKRSANIEQKKTLVSLKGSLSDQQKVVAVTKQNKNTLLSETKNKESNYKKLLAEEIAQRDAYQKEINEYESQLRIELDPSLLPSYGSKVLTWPVDNPRITQYFGNTSFSKKRADIYNGRGHSGIDFGAPIGTPIKAAASGVVEGTGDTDLVCKGVSWGRWVFVRHNNGLATIYGHLSVIKAVKGQVVRAGDLIAYSGSTGRSTGPHLHFSVYASQGVHVKTRTSAICGPNFTVPVASGLQSYLNPLDYL